MKVSNDVANVRFGGHNTRHEHVSWIKGLHVALSIDGLRIEDEPLEKSVVVLADDICEIWSAPTEMTTGAAQFGKFPLATFSCRILLQK
jgi:hypothetical protein